MEMTERLSKSPIIEAVVDLNCDMPPLLDLATLEARARSAFGDRYPEFRTHLLQEAMSAADTNAPNRSARRGLQALQFLQGEQQLVQVRTAGFSFNRLAPYSSLDDYLPEIARTWRIFVELAMPLQVRQVRLRYLNRIQLPIKSGLLNLDEYLVTGPRLPDEERLKFLGFLHRHGAVEPKTGNSVNVVLASQPAEGDVLPVILDIEAMADASLLPEEWPLITARIQSLRSLKNLVFQRTLTERCLELF